MKKTLLASLAALMTAAIVFMGCQAPVNSIPTDPNKLVQLEKPTITAKTYPGAIVVTFDIGKDAKYYELTRKNETTGEVIVIHPWGIGDEADKIGGYVADVIGQDTQINGVPVDPATGKFSPVNGQKFTYTIYNRAGNNGETRAVSSPGTEGGTTPGTGPEGFLNNQASYTVTAIVKDPQLTELKNVDAKPVTQYEYSDVTGSVPGFKEVDNVKVSWDAITYNPAVNILLRYSYGGDPLTGSNPLTDTGGPTSDTSNFGVTSITRKLASSTSSDVSVLLGGKTTIEVGPVFGDGTYYDTPPFIKKQYDLPLSYLAAVKIAKVTPTDTLNKVVVSWVPAEGAAEGIAGSEVWKAEVEGSTSALTPGTVTLKSDWTKVPLDQAEYVPADGTHVDDVSGDDYSYYKVRDTVEDVKKVYVYAFVSRNEGMKSSTPFLKFLSKATFPDPNPSDLKLMATVVNTFDVNVSFQNMLYGADGYKLYRVPGVEITEDGNTRVIPTEDYPTTPIAMGVNTSTEGGWITYIDTPPEPRQAYRYKITLTKDTLTKDFYTDLCEPPYSASVNQSFNVAASPAYAKAIRLTFPDLDDAADKE